MAVNYIDPGAGALSGAIAAAGSGLALKLTEKQRREKALRENPQQMQALAAAYRRAQAAGAGPSFLEGIGVRPEFGGQILAFQPNVAEVTESEMLAKGTPQAQVRAETGEANVRADTAEGLIRRNIIGMQQDNEVQNQILAGRGIAASLLQNLPEEEAYTKRNVLGAQASEARFNNNLFRRRTENGVDRLTVDSEVLGEQARQAGFRLDASTLNAYKDYLDNLDPSSHEYAVALSGLRNPAQLSHIQFHEGMNFEMSLAATKAKGTPEDVLANTIKVQEQYSKARNDYQQLLADKDFPSAAKQQLIIHYNDNLNAWRRIAEDMQADGSILPINASLTALENKGRLEFYTREFQSEDARNIFALMANRARNRDDVAGDPLQQLKANSEFWGSLPQRDREQLEAGWADYLVEQRAAQEAEARSQRVQREQNRISQQNLMEIYQGTNNAGAALDRLVQKFNDLNAQYTRYLYQRDGRPIPPRWQAQPGGGR